MENEIICDVNESLLQLIIEENHASGIDIGINFRFVNSETEIASTSEKRSSINFTLFQIGLKSEIPKLSNIKKNQREESIQYTRIVMSYILTADITCQSHNKKNKKDKDTKEHLLLRAIMLTLLKYPKLPLSSLSGDLPRQLVKKPSINVFPKRLKKNARDGEIDRPALELSILLLLNRKSGPAAGSIENRSLESILSTGMNGDALRATRREGSKESKVQLLFPSWS